MTVQSTSPFVIPSGGLMLGFGAPLLDYFDSTALTATGTITLTPVGPQSTVIPFTRGRLRVKSVTPNAATTIAIGILTGTDGTNTVELGGAMLAVTAAGTNFDISKEFNCDLQLT